MSVQAFPWAFNHTSDPEYFDIAQLCGKPTASGDTTSGISQSCHKWRHFTQLREEESTTFIAVSRSYFNTERLGTKLKVDPMRLLNTKSLIMKEFLDIDEIEYAILSHTLEDDEISLQELQSPSEATFTKNGY